MGALHDGHLALVAALGAKVDRVAVTIFVNPTQFAPGEDFGRYPRTFAADRALLEAEGVDLLFAPSAEEMYPPGATTSVLVDELSDRLDGASRPGHFRGVATVVAKLFHILGPDRAYFGQKDAAQVAVLRRMVRDLNFPLELVVCPTVREPDGLAMSSRNRYLSPHDRADARVLYQALEAGARCESPEAALAAAQAVLRAAGGAIRLDYLAAVHPDTLEPVTDFRSGALLAIAAWVGSTRLIDNILIGPRP
jgi:pantoate--beta-alanine ligase